ncbi:MAG TPA: metal-sulfur cluster assembly factor [Gaiellaceae bacterium]|nr:metal-sulfur cluster assembly factor [Gaiellaceae bacterium]
MSFSRPGPVEAARDRLSTVQDPELGLDIVSLGVVYSVELEDARLRIVYTLTSMGCPLGPVIERDIARALEGLEGVESVESLLVFEPPWSPEQMSDDAKLLLGVYG